jgi:hypothetical protein
VHLHLIGHGLSIFISFFFGVIKISDIFNAKNQVVHVVNFKIGEMLVMKRMFKHLECLVALKNKLMCTGMTM